MQIFRFYKGNRVMVDKKAIEREVCSNIFSLTGKKIDDINANVFGKPYYINPRDMVYLYIDIQEKYTIRISENVIKKHNLVTVGEIVETILDCMNMI